MLGHMGVNVQDLRRAKAYYDTLMPLLGFEENENRNFKRPFAGGGDRADTLPACYRQRRCGWPGA